MFVYILDTAQLRGDVTNLLHRCFLFLMMSNSYHGNYPFFIVTSRYPYNYVLWTKKVSSFTEQVFRLTVVLLIMYSIRIEPTVV